MSIQMNSAKFDLKKIIEERRAQILERKAALKVSAIPFNSILILLISTEKLYISGSSARSYPDSCFSWRIFEWWGNIFNAFSQWLQQFSKQGTASHGAVVDFKKLIEERRAEILKRINAQKAAVQPLDDAVKQFIFCNRWSSYFRLRRLISVSRK